MNIVSNNNPWFSSIFDDILTQNKLDVPNCENFSTPPVNIKEKSTNFVIEIAIPGLSKSDFKIEIEDAILKVSSTTSETTSTEDTEKIKEDFTSTRKEFAINGFNRSFKLPETIDVDAIEANYEAGILTLSLPKREEQKALKKMVEIS